MTPINYVKRTDLLYVSLFYPRDAWHKLIKRAVIPFLNLSSERYGIHYICHFNTYRGDAINFTIQVKHNKNDFVLFFHEYFQQYLNDNPASSGRDQEEFESVFMDFPINSIRYGLHDFPFNGRRRFDLNKLFVLQETSTIFLDALSKGGDTFDVTALALNIYSNCRIFYETLNNKAGQQLNGQGIDTQLQDLLDTQYDENIELVEQVIMNNYNIIYKKKAPRNHGWLTRWSDLSKKLIENRPSLSSGFSKSSFKEFIAYSKKQLGLAQDEEVLIQYFVNKAISESIYTNH
ncbi:MAG: hypothetical protein AAGC65_05685 [Mucilaginibacter sp.]|uniref:hypothetical protein n=1 Tax=Mucilaginibacter sp. TaxID=1882438 RepID=UPI0031A5F268